MKTSNKFFKNDIAKDINQEMITLGIGQLVPKNLYTFKAYLCLFDYQIFITSS